MTMIDQKLLEFARWAIAEHRMDFEDLDAFAIQDKLEELGLLIKVSVTEPCGESCRCAEYVDKWPSTCLRLAGGVFEKEA